jgi:3-phenylpropionate/cinnamic acid dioxygenase small subunit
VNASAQLAAVEDLLCRETRFLDAQRWTEWLDLYCDDAVFWAPSVTMAGAYTTDPLSELNFIYIVGRTGFEARVFRLQSGGSLASNPLPRTRHLVTNVMIDDDGPSEVKAFANFQTATFSEARGQQIRNGAYEYVLRKQEEGMRIAQKKILLLEFVIDGYFDFFTI